jgi:hypothetical protein
MIIVLPMFVMVDGDSQQDMFTGVPGDDDLPEETEEESQWRMERYEREKFLQEKQVRCFVAITYSS